MQKSEKKRVFCTKDVKEYISSAPSPASQEVGNKRQRMLIKREGIQDFEGEGVLGVEL